MAPVAGSVVVGNDEPDIVPAQLPAATGDEAAGVTNPMGNHVVIAAADEEFVMIAHMQQGSVTVQPGDVVRAGDSLGKVGNSGNTTEPHVHIQAQNRADLTAPDLVSRPMRFTNVLVDGAPVDQATPVQGQFVEQA
jgi:murein DD-endopeptidase MepM/ murein hydrolase activator NlpD